MEWLVLSLAILVVIYFVLDHFKPQLDIVDCEDKAIIYIIYNSYDKETVSRKRKLLTTLHYERR